MPEITDQDRKILERVETKCSDQDLMAYIKDRPDFCKPCLMMESMLLRLETRNSELAIANQRIAELEKQLAALKDEQPCS